MKNFLRNYKIFNQLKYMNFKNYIIKIMIVIKIIHRYNYLQFHFTFQILFKMIHRSMIFIYNIINLII